MQYPEYLILRAGTLKKEMKKDKERKNMRM
jgi:hypothetical protein